jgi:hypothetical protein
VNFYFFTVNPNNPRCPNLAELAAEIAHDPITSWSIPAISPYRQKIRKGERFLFLQQAGKNAPKNAPRGIIGCGDILGPPFPDEFGKTGEAGWFVKLLFQHFIDPMKNPELRLDRKWILSQPWGQSVYSVRQSGWLVQPERTGELILKAFLKRLARYR